MAQFHRTENGTPWLKITCQELSGYSDNSRPICDECLTSLIGCDEVVLIPIFNEAFCPKCGKERLAHVHRYPEDIPIEERRAQFYNPLVPVPGENIWYTPMYFRDVWHYRRLWWTVDRMICSGPQPAETLDDEETATREEPPAEQPPEPAPQALGETPAGQLTLF